MTTPRKILVTIVCLLALQLTSASAAERTVEELKQQILQLARSYQGQGDPDQSKQKTLDVLVEELVKKKPMPPIAQRLGVLAGAWQQVWGPYDYRNDDGGVDPRLGIEEIYQVVSPEGHYYNVSPYYKKGKEAERIGLLRGEYKLDSSDPNGLKVRFTRYPGVEGRPQGVELWQLAELAETDRLPNEVSIVPTWVVRLFFGGGKLEEVYTDHDLRLVYGSGRKKGARRSLYVMSRVE